MLADAITKLRDEMDANKSNPYIQVVGDFLIDHIIKETEEAEKILNPEKSIAKSLDEMRKAAEKKKVGNCAVLTDQEGFEVVLKYFGINGSPASLSNNAPEPAEPPKQAPNFDIKLEDLLG